MRRRDTEWLAAQQAGRTAVFLSVAGGKVAATIKDDHASLNLRDSAGRDLTGAIFLGLRDEVAHFAQIVPEAEEQSFVELRGIGSLLSPDEASLAAYAVALARWHAGHGFCGVCGAPTMVEEAGHKRVCTRESCHASHFPRTDPAIIVLVEEGDACFLARNAGYRPGMHSTLAGFVEPGESLEATVEREVWEEAGIMLSDIAYHSSQPWPFPASLMVGYRARAVSRTFEVDGEEIVGGGWFTRPEIEASLDYLPTNEAFNLPGQLSISRKLIEDWLRNPDAV